MVFIFNAINRQLIFDRSPYYNKNLNSYFELLMTIYEKYLMFIKDCMVLPAQPLKK